jgi:hypothetical protein
MYRAFQLVSAWLEESTCVVRMYTRESRVICTSRLAYTVWHLRALGHHHKAVRLSKVVALAVLAAIVDATPLERLLSALERRHPPAITHEQPKGAHEHDRVVEHFGDVASLLLLQLWITLCVQASQMRVTHPSSAAECAPCSLLSSLSSGMQ